VTPEPRANTRCPVLVVTGGLGSGKSTLLQHWLREEILQQCALIVNEIGEVPFDASRLGLDIQAAGIVTQQCVCCSGLPDLQDTLERFFWDRLHRKMRRFDRIVIETTGVANPKPLVELMSGHPFLREKFRLEAVITTVSGVAAWPEPEDAVAYEQIGRADILVITKRDRIDPSQESALRARLSGAAPRAATVAVSGRGQLPKLATLLGSVVDRTRTAQGGHPHTTNAVMSWQSRHLGARPAGPKVRTWFEAIEQPLELDEMRQRAAHWIARAQSQRLVRFKGLWRCKGPISGDHPWEVQWTHGDAFAQIDPVSQPGACVAWGVTFIAAAS
jgi:G3E family GTPase